MTQPRVRHRRSETEPFQIEILTSRLGLGVDVGRDEDGHAQITHIAKSGPVARNSHVK